MQPPATRSSPSSRPRSRHASHGSVKPASLLERAWSVRPYPVCAKGLFCAGCFTPALERREVPVGSQVSVRPWPIVCSTSRGSAKRSTGGERSGVEGLYVFYVRGVGGRGYGSGNSPRKTCPTTGGVAGPRGGEKKLSRVSPWLQHAFSLGGWATSFLPLPLLSNFRHSLAHWY